ncbi:DUF4913 domain-containing protein [Nocardia camponoti]|nr:DUF4913 domain-containing protein [Nocardia camponoti]
MPYPGAIAEETSETVYPDAMSWFDGYFSKVFGDALGYRPGDGLKWCPEWWRHPSAVVRVDALWQVWEECERPGGPAVSDWLLRHADPHMAALTSVNGPFRQCSVERGHRETYSLPVTDSGMRGGYLAPSGRGKAQLVRGS